MTKSSFGELTLYHYWRSTSSWRVRWALELKGLKAKMVPINLLNDESERPEHLARHPLGYVPVLQVGANKNLGESVAIIEWLEENFPQPPLYPGDSFNKAHIRSLCELINAGTQPLQNLSVLDYYSTDQSVRDEWTRFFVKRGLSAYEKLVEQSAGKYSVGDKITAADLFLIPQCYHAGRFNVPLTPYPTISRIFDAAMKTPEAIASAPESHQP